MIGSLFLSLSFAMALISAVAYALALREGEKERFLRIARMGFHGAVIGFMLTAATLMYLILTYQYQYTYIYEHASNNLSRPLLMASFYAGQEGSFMLWTLLVALIGVFVLGYAQRVRYEAEAMAPYMLVLVLLLLIIVVKSPFMLLSESFPKENIPAGFMPDHGKGLNPTLENIWITIHPPILFTGFAAMTVPFVFAIAGLIKRDYQRWIAVSLPWVLFASMVLGFGIMLGGWWAYETLGWGGFWAWDPVENSSLIPWLACVSLVHTMLVQRRTGTISRTGEGTDSIGGLVKTNFILAIASFGLILYSTFLTRSGVLGDTSVHSFVSPGGFIYGVLLAIIFIFMGLGITMLVRRWRELSQASHQFTLMSRETALALGSSVLLAIAFIVLLGTSYPIFAPLIGRAKASFQPDFYNSLELPIAIVLVLLNGISMRMKWKNTDPGKLLRDLLVAIMIAAVGTVGLVLLQVHDPVYIALGFGSLLAMVVNLQVGVRVMRGNPRFVGAYVSHAGVALLMLGIIFTARYSETEHVRLVQGVPKKVFGYVTTYTGPERIELEKVDREKFQHNVQLVKDGDTSIVRPIIFKSDFNNREDAFIEPGIKYMPTKDLYISPKALDEEGGDPIITLKKGEKRKVPFDSSLTLRFEKFDMSRAASEGKQGAVMEITSADSTYFLTSYRSMKGDEYLPVNIPGTDITVGMYGLNVVDKQNLSKSEVLLRFNSPSHPVPPPKQAITLDISIKPFISFVWAGVVIMVGGFFFSILRRRKELLGYLPQSEDRQAVPTARPGIRGDRPSNDPIAARTGLRK